MFHLVECEIQHKKRRHARGDIYLTGMLDVFLRLRKLLSLLLPSLCKPAAEAALQIYIQ